MPYAGPLSDFADFQRRLVGTWENRDLPGASYNEKPAGGRYNPLSYNVMPLPQDAVPGKPKTVPFHGFILENFRFYETIRFSDHKNTPNPDGSYGTNLLGVHAAAPNRGGRIEQIGHAIFYDQTVFFAEGPKAEASTEEKDRVVHVENGSWLYLTKNQQLPGPFPPGVGDPPLAGQPQPPDIAIAKQIAVPHGNTVLALGGFSAETGGMPAFGEAEPPYAKLPASWHERYAQKLVPPDAEYENPHPDWTKDPKMPLRLAADAIKPDGYIYWRVIAREGGPNSAIISIPFEEKRADVKQYDARYWLFRKDDEFKYLAYIQTMEMEMPILDGGAVTRYRFDHVTSNVVTKIL